MAHVPQLPKLYNACGLHSLLFMNKLVGDDGNVGALHNVAVPPDMRLRLASTILQHATVTPLADLPPADPNFRACQENSDGSGDDLIILDAPKKRTM